MAAKFYKSEFEGGLNFIKVDGEFTYNFASFGEITVFEKYSTANFSFDAGVFKEVDKSEIQEALDLLNSEINGI
jgi:hypothetical protein